MPTELYLRGYSVIPTPRKVTLLPGDVTLDESWRLEASDTIAARTLVRDLKEFHGLELGRGAGKSIRLAVRKGALTVPDDAALRDQGYRLSIGPAGIEVTGNADAGLFYGVQTLVQLIREGPRGRLRAPVCRIEDWPERQLRFLHWDTKHHQDRIETLKRYLDWSARFKANMIGFELEDKFEYPSNPVIGAPGAFTTAELQQIVDYGRERFIQVAPVIQAPAHMTYVLKHPQFAHLRADGNNYQSCLCLEDTYKLIFQMYDDVIQATRGVGYLHASTDEVYYAGIGANCKEPYNPVNRSLKWAEFAQRARDHLARRGRRMLAWIEYPLLAEHMKLIPSDVIDGVMGEEEYMPVQRQKGMRQLIYVSTQGAEFLFPDHFPLDTAARARPGLEFEEGMDSGRLRSTYESLLHGRATRANPIGVFGAAWDDSGLHNETFWVGWSAVARWGWNPGTPGVEQHAAEFMNLYYGSRVEGMVEAYRTLQRQARCWQRTWDRVTSRVRGPGYGNSYGKGVGTQRFDLALEPPALPEGPELKFEPAFSKKYEQYVAVARARTLESDQLAHSITGNLSRAERNQYNLEVMLALARFIGHHWRLLTGLADAERSLSRASALAKDNPRRAIGVMVGVSNAVGRLERGGLEHFRTLEQVFEKSRFPKGRSVGGRKYVHVLDDTKDHWADRTPDLGFMYAPERGMRLGEWRGKLQAAIAAFARAHDLPVRGLEEERLEH